ncbi:MAG TPA: crosslink repair DNA glycosylase YcaQ family protein, partial [Anaerolineae bacterium]
MSSNRRDRPEEVVQWLGGVQAQDYQWAKWSIGLRTNECTDDDVEQAIGDVRIVRTWMFRGSLHFVAASDLAWLTLLLAPGIIKGNTRRYTQLELDNAAFARS